MTAEEVTAARLQRGDQRFDLIEAQLTQIVAATLPLAEMQKDVAATREIVEAWNTVKNVGRFVKWVGPIMAALAAVVLWGKAWWVFFRG